MLPNKKFAVGDTVIYPSHGVGTIQSIEKQKIGGMDIEFFVIFFDKEKMSLRVPLSKAKKTGLRHIISQNQLEDVFEILQSKPKPCKGMWSRRAAEYEAKINSGELKLISEVVRDLHKNVNDPDRSYSERVIYESALSRLVSEISIIEKISYKEAEEKIIEIIQEMQVV